MARNGGQPKCPGITWYTFDLTDLDTDWQALASQLVKRSTTAQPWGVPPRGQDAARPPTGLG